MLAAGVGGVLVFGLSGREGDFDPAGLTSPFGATGDVLVAPFARWDSVWFLAIAADGYGDGAREAFFPLYPLLVRIAGAPLGLAPARRRARLDAAARASRSCCCTGSSRSTTGARSRATPCS